MSSKRGAFVRQGWISMPKIGGHGEVACGIEAENHGRNRQYLASEFFESSTSRPGLMRVPAGGPEVELSAR